MQSQKLIVESLVGWQSWPKIAACAVLHGIRLLTVVVIMNSVDVRRRVELYVQLAAVPTDFSDCEKSVSVLCPGNGYRNGSVHVNKGLWPTLRNAHFSV